MNRAQYAAMFRKLERTRTRWAECIRITRPDGTIFRFTSHDADLFIADDIPGEGALQRWKSAGGFSITNLETSRGLVVSNMNIDAIISDDEITDADLRNGLYDHANVELFLAYWSGPRVTMLPLRTSWIGELVISGKEYKADLRGIAQKLAQVFVSATSLDCRWTFCDQNSTGRSFCGLNAATYTSSGAVLSAQARDIFVMSGTPTLQADNYYQWGLVTFTSGDNEGAKMEVLRHYGDRVQLFLPLAAPISPGDTFDIIAGCNKTFEQCQTFGNEARFGGEPYLEGADTLTRVGIPDRTPENNVDDGSGSIFGGND